MYLAGDFLYHHWTPFRDVANDVGHATVDVVDDIGHNTVKQADEVGTRLFGLARGDLTIGSWF